ncbi:serine/threonine-protein kinase-like protein At3g51990 [Juglans microcarpa x Juglans regia]|uniref:serine/threonine-protein kinase-like protein At3g51990 n=1 Tax=Juglans microcarpa x Juglans regia TaxID=2249226 RepID=UPI001B7E7AD7|nr:serine/threonine-protein kinase-like protein At3g51990 [Juglans microcarpa x Juglans regia]
MGYLSCNADSAIAICDSYYSAVKNRPRTRTRKHSKAVQIRQFLHSELVAATDGFSAECFLGKGSHGSVYKAVLDDGKLVAAVKRTKLLNPSTTTTSFQNHQYHNSNCTNCCNCTSPAENEIEILSRVQHPRLVNLLGFCSDSSNRKLLVVEYMPNGSLYDLLHSTSRSPPGWTRRVRFAVQIAKAVLALHSSNPPVIHRDIKSSNVLIDENRNARLGDFGLALRGHVEDVRIKCTPPAGTLGYLDPGYLAPGDLSTKSDVFSFGILLLEIISGRHAIDVNYSPPSVVDWAVPLIKHGEFSGICDYRISTPSDLAVIRHLAVLAARCVRSSAEKRPDMAEVVECLKIVAKKVHTPPIWKNLRQRVTCVDNTTRSLMKWETYDMSEDVVKVTKLGSRRNRKVSSVPGADYGSEPTGSVGDRMVRSKSVGYYSETNAESDSNLSANRRVSGRMKPGMAVKMPVVKLSKSRSMGVLQSPRLVQYNKSRGFLFEFGRNNIPETSTGIDMSKLVIGLDEESENIMLEKPLVSTFHII